MSFTSSSRPHRGRFSNMPIAPPNPPASPTIDSTTSPTRKPNAAQILTEALRGLEDQGEPVALTLSTFVEAEQEAANAPQTPAGILAAALGGGASAPALNSVAILRAALGSSQGTVNGE
jgi:hypothetical protein